MVAGENCQADHVDYRTHVREKCNRVIYVPCLFALNWSKTTLECCRKVRFHDLQDYPLSLVFVKAPRRLVVVLLT